MVRILIPISLTLLLACAAPLATDETAGATNPAAADVKGDIDAAAQGWTLIEQGALLIDVRSPAEYELGHIEGASNIPHTDIDAIASAIGEDHSRSVVLYCGSGRRAGNAQKLLEELGYDSVFNASGLSALQATQP